MSQKEVLSELKIDNKVSLPRTNGEDGRIDGEKLSASDSVIMPNDDKGSVATEISFGDTTIKGDPNTVKALAKRRMKSTELINIFDNITSIIIAYKRPILIAIILWLTDAGPTVLDFIIKLLGKG